MKENTAFCIFWWVSGILGSCYKGFINSETKGTDTLLYNVCQYTLWISIPGKCYFTLRSSGTVHMFDLSSEWL